MKEEIYKICTQLNDGQIAVTQAQEQLLLLFSVSKRHLLESILEDCKSRYFEHHYEIVESYLDDGG
jgi:hypothetical protein